MQITGWYFDGIMYVGCIRKCYLLTNTVEGMESCFDLVTGMVWLSTS